jgi:hypothetical protein
MTREISWSDVRPDEIVALDLPDVQRELMMKGLMEWAGPARPTDTLARAMGYADPDKLIEGCYRLRTALGEKQEMSKRNWARGLVATEIVFASRYYGAAGEWALTTGWSDEFTLRVLRNLQRSLLGLRAWRHDVDEQDPLFVDPSD